MTSILIRPPPSLPYPAVSVIIPLYNVEKYVGECLDSLLEQTFQNFEVIVVDDCSTDNSVAVVESYVEKFGGRLRLVKMKKNSGSATAPRNMGLSLSRGEYIQFMDDDDTITPTALEEMYTLAKKFDADIVQCEKCFDVSDEFWSDAEYRKNLKPSCWPAGEKIFITKPTLLDENFERRAVEFTKRWLTWSVWLQLIRRDFIFENQIKFVGVVIDDMLFTLCEICSAKKYLVVPNVTYNHRVRADSLLWQDNRKLEKFLHSRLTMLREGVSYLDEFLNETEIFATRPDLKYLLFDMFTQEIRSHLTAIYAKVPAPALDEILRKEFVSDQALTSFIFSLTNIQRLQLMQAQGRIAELENALRTR